MSMSNAISRMLAVAGPLIVARSIEFGGMREDFFFRRLPFIEADRLRVAVIGDNGKFDGDKFVGNNARLVAASLVDEEGKQLATFDEVCLWPTELVDKLAEAANEVNRLTSASSEAAAKNSEKTPGAVSS